MIKFDLFHFFSDTPQLFMLESRRKVWMLRMFKRLKHNLQVIGLISGQTNFKWVNSLWSLTSWILFHKPWSFITSYKGNLLYKVCASKSVYFLRIMYNNLLVHTLFYILHIMHFCINFVLKCCRIVKVYLRIILMNQKNVKEQMWLIAGWCSYWKKLIFHN